MFKLSSMNKMIYLYNWSATASINSSGQSFSVSCFRNSAHISSEDINSISVLRDLGAEVSSSDSSSVSLPRCVFFFVDFVFTSRPCVPPPLLPAANGKNRKVNQGTYFCYLLFVSVSYLVLAKLS